MFGLISVPDVGIELGAACTPSELASDRATAPGHHRVNIIKLQVMFEWSLEWDCRGQISLPTGMGGKLKIPSSCTVTTINYVIEDIKPENQL